MIIKWIMRPTRALKSKLKLIRLAPLHTPKPHNEPEFRSAKVVHGREWRGGNLNSCRKQWDTGIGCWILESRMATKLVNKFEVSLQWGWVIWDYSVDHDSLDDSEITKILDSDLLCPGDRLQIHCALRTCICLNRLYFRYLCPVCGNLRNAI